MLVLSKHLNSYTIWLDRRSPVGAEQWDATCADKAYRVLQLGAYSTRRNKAT